MSEESIKDVIKRVSAGNIGALSILMEAIQFNELLGLALLGNLDRVGLRGPQVWNLSKIAGRDPKKTAMILCDETGEIIRTLLSSEDLDWPTMTRLAESVGTKL